MKLHQPRVYLSPKLCRECGRRSTVFSEGGMRCLHCEAEREAWRTKARKRREEREQEKPPIGGLKPT
ncbi:hypothetical protein Q31a_13220 [Aureliella helgolandensis]|uniref:Uncharacterized protein n=1 Tax=Aureliella helgolandensis TaxID=2527968 RepID=A0A518G3B1_9BACT|nr:hypothetical protein Q31a_13220 [Aureliella helgolandensis]